MSEIEENISEQMEVNATVFMNLNQTSSSNFLSVFSRYAPGIRDLFFYRCTTREGR